MARPLKEGLEYFSHDTNMSSDPKILCLEAECGIKGYAVYNKLLEMIYSSPTGEVDLSQDISETVLAKKFGVSIKFFKNVLISCIKFKLFDENIYVSKKSITSHGIQKRFLAVSQERERKRQWKMEHKSKSNDKDVDGDNPATSKDIDSNKSATSDSCDGKLTSTDSYKEKESKVNESKVNNNINTVSKDTVDSKGQPATNLNDLKESLSKITGVKEKVGFLGNMFIKFHQSAKDEHSGCFGRIGNIVKKNNYDYNLVLCAIIKTQDGLKNIEGKHLSYIESTLEDKDFKSQNNGHNPDPPTSRYEYVN